MLYLTFAGFLCNNLCMGVTIQNQGLNNYSERIKFVYYA